MYFGKSWKKFATNTWDCTCTVMGEIMTDHADRSRLKTGSTKT